MVVGRGKMGGARSGRRVEAEREGPKKGGETLGGRYLECLRLGGGGVEASGVLAYLTMTTLLLVPQHKT